MNRGDKPACSGTAIGGGGRKPGVKDVFRYAEKEKRAEMGDSKSIGSNRHRSPNQRMVKTHSGGKKTNAWKEERGSWTTLSERY